MEKLRLASEATAAKRLQAQAQLAASQAAKEEAAAKAAQHAADKAQVQHAPKVAKGKNQQPASGDILTVRLPKPPKNATSAKAP